mgnify:CR=1 FL=1
MTRREHQHLQAQHLLTRFFSLTITNSIVAAWEKASADIPSPAARAIALSKLDRNTRKTILTGRTP